METSGKWTAQRKKPVISALTAQCEYFFVVVFYGKKGGKMVAKIRRFLFYSTFA